MATKFTAQFIEESMRQHKLRQHDEERQMLEEIIEEVQMIRRGPRKITPFLDFEDRINREARRVQ